MRKLQFTIMVFALFICCSNINNNIELNYISSLDYISRNGIGDSYVDIIKNGWRDYKINFKSKNDTLFAFGSRLDERNKEYRLGPWISSRVILSSNPVCEKTVLVNQAEITYKFCYSDIINYFDNLIEKCENVDVYYCGSKKQKERFLKWISGTNEILYMDNTISDLITNIPFSASDNYRKNSINKIITNTCYTGWSGGGQEHFLLNKSNDTIAYFGYTRWVN